MIKQYLNQTASWEKKIGIDGYASPIYSAPTTIKVRIEGKRKLVRNLQGKEVTTELIVTTVDDVKPDDRINGLTVITVDEVPDINGKLQFKKVYL